jgi:hypothetical protein
MEKVLAVGVSSSVLKEREFFKSHIGFFMGIEQE